MKIITKYSSYILAFLLLSIFTQSCREEPLEVTPIGRSTVMSYSDLFDNFWDEMNNNYNYFFEEDYDWDAIYEIYSPKFKKLRTFNDIDADPNVAKREIQLAFKYFADIISKIKDRHFSVSIKIPFSANKGGINYNWRDFKIIKFRGGMKYKYSVEDGFELINDDSANPKVNSSIVRKLMEEDKLISSTVFKKSLSAYQFLSGYLKSDPSTMYINFSGFKNASFFDPLRQFPLLRVVEKDKMKEDVFDNFSKVDRANAQYFKQKMEDNIANMYSSFLSVFKSDEYKEYLDARAHFFQTEDISKLDAIKEDFANFSSEKAQRYINERDDIYNECNKYFKANYENNFDKSKAIDEALNEYYSVFKNLFKLSHFIGYADRRTASIGAVVKESCDIYGTIYKKLFNLITKGEVKKLIIDLRGNRGGSSGDTNYFVSRFISKKSNAGYYRTKQGDGRFNYGPWLPFEIEPSKFSTPKSIPTIILLDRGSASMSEITSMILKGQEGDNNVKIIGDNSAGATAALGSQDAFNGGSRINAGYFNFYMPMMAYKTLEGKTIEADGITPDIKVIPTKEEVENMKTTKYDPALEKALEEIRKMTVN